MKLLTFENLELQKGHPYSRVHTARLIKAGKFPAPIKLGDGPQARVAWIEEEIDAHYAALADQRGGSRAA